MRNILKKHKIYQFIYASTCKHKFIFSFKIYCAQKITDLTTNREFDARYSRSISF